jgi:uncharacterized membrane-anchored protein
LQSERAPLSSSSFAKEFIVRFTTLFASPFAVCLALTSPALAEPFKAFFPDDYDQMSEEERAFFDRFDLKQGTIPLAGGIAELNVSPDYYFLDASTARIVLEELWGNPPDDTVAGILFPRDGWALNGSWGATLTYDAMGYVSDAEAESYNYDDMLAQMQADLIEENKWRTQNGYETITLVGWAEPPHYDGATNEVYWAKRLQFGHTAGDETLNYDIRELGRQGVMITSFIGAMEQLDDIKASSADIRGMISFTEGNRYTDFNPETDRVAEYDVGGLISGSPIAAAGLVAIALAFLKKGGFLLLLAPIGWVVNRFRGGGTR